jgi:hypothetical protein
LTAEEDAERADLIEYQSKADLERDMRLIGSIMSQSE